VVEATCHNPFITVNSSTAAVYRSISEDPPTMLVDEADTIFGANADGNEDLRGLLNAGHQRNRPAKRYDAATKQVESIPTFAMAALAGIGAMPDTIEDRAVIVRMRRRAPNEKVSPYRHRRDRPGLRDLAEQLAAWLRADLAILEKTEPAMPVEDRAADTWEPLVAVADHAGGDWPERARTAVLVMTTDAAENDQADSDSLALLIDCRTAFGEELALPTSELLRRLTSEEEARWRECGPTGLTARKLGALLREFEVRSTTMRFPGFGQAKGYLRAAFTDAWQRYCPPEHERQDGQEAGSREDQEGEPYQPYQAHIPSSERYASQNWYGSSRTAKTAVPGLTSQNETGTADTDTPLKLVRGDT
jgi:hypothetical protein